jgi:hypothetical protein
LKKCSKLETIYLEGNPFLTRELQETVRLLLYTVNNDIFTEKTKDSSGQRLEEIMELQMVENYLEECFLESLFRKLDLHT